MPRGDAWLFDMRGKREGTTFPCAFSTCEGLAGRVRVGRNEKIWCGKEKRVLGQGAGGGPREWEILVLLL